jgi:hypothetical protein
MATDVSGDRQLLLTVALGTLFDVWVQEILHARDVMSLFEWWPDRQLD